MPESTTYEQPISEELNKALKTNPSKTLHQRTAFFGYLGWFVAVLLLIGFILQSIVFSFKPEPIMTADPETGAINGQVVFNDVVIRDNATIIRDLKSWTSARLSLNSSTIFEDAQIALNHMCGDLQEEVYKDWSKTAYLATIKQTKGVSKIEFNDDAITLIRRKQTGSFEAVIDGTIKVGIVNPSSQKFRIELKGKLLPKTQNHSLGLEICSNEDV